MRTLIIHLLDTVVMYPALQAAVYGKCLLFFNEHVRSSTDARNWFSKVNFLAFNSFSFYIVNYNIAIFPLVRTSRFPSVSVVGFQSPFQKCDHCVFLLNKSCVRGQMFWHVFKLSKHKRVVHVVLSSKLWPSRKHSAFLMI